MGPLRHLLASGLTGSSPKTFRLRGENTSSCCWALGTSLSCWSLNLPMHLAMLFINISSAESLEWNPVACQDLELGSQGAYRGERNEQND